MARAAELKAPCGTYPKVNCTKALGLLLLRAEADQDFHARQKRLADAVRNKTTTMRNRWRED